MPFNTEIQYDRKIKPFATENKEKTLLTIKPKNESDVGIYSIKVRFILPSKLKKQIEYNSELEVEVFINERFQIIPP